MQEKEYTDIISLLKHLCIVLQPFANTRNIKLDFTGAAKEIKIDCAAGKLLNGFNKLCSAIIDYMPDNNTLYINTEVIKNDEAKYVSVKIRNTGINLKQVPAITNNCGLPASIFSSSANETVYEVCYSLSCAVVTDTEKQTVNGGPFNYINFVKGIKSHFSKLKNPVERLAETKPKEAAFLTNINQCILKNLEDERFDANALSIAIAMSRAQLFRRLKSLTGNSPGYYIKTIRLEKAKELLETDITVSEAAYKTGFNSPSNFTKVFSEKYGITPSQFRRPKRDATNE